MSQDTNSVKNAPEGFTTFQSGVSIRISRIFHVQKTDMVDQTGDDGVIVQYDNGSQLRLKGQQASEVWEHFSAV